MSTCSDALRTADSYYRAASVTNVTLLSLDFLELCKFLLAEAYGSRHGNFRCNRETLSAVITCRTSAGAFQRRKSERPGAEARSGAPIKYLKNTEGCLQYALLREDITAQEACSSTKEPGVQWRCTGQRPEFGSTRPRTMSISPRISLRHDDFFLLYKTPNIF